ncbi:MAG: 50S ribosomal protein L5 [Candidatus Latescibacteria bacterium]|jgi:large subunit ribosomal protein L5|nr:50S ribosomal protein L5 [Candidatus Latescibacterota bacterium]
MAPRLKEKYKNEIAPALMKEFGFKNPMQIPSLEKIVVNIGVGEAVQEMKLLENAVGDLGIITGQKPIIKRARKSISNFKLREGMPVGCMVTLRGSRMYEFLDRLLNFAIPRIRDFRGVPGRSFDGHGNYTLGIKEQIIFPEIDFDKIDKTRGMDITIVMKTNKDEEAKALLRAFGMPFRD